ncbi:hypothetical protein DQQ10_07185 [Pseudochryseolinea flava]|uniref:Uncharacterized protein n=2 Tax=Pseudochryseolinea flava TaxID=2059302 RepID=A0A364Y8Y0_9BACT|nr:hypothetical protein DQQ10_07185 [Pseudochryseolinea flava]
MLWAEENKALEARLKLNESLLRKMSFDKAVDTLTPLLTFSIFGRYLALVYCGISIVFAIKVWPAFLYCIPTLVGGAAMLWSFFSHRSLKMLDYSALSILDLQKEICQFRIHTSKMERYDMGIVILWLITTTPSFLLTAKKIAIYENRPMLLSLCMAGAAIAAFVFLFTRLIYGAYNTKLLNAEADLKRISDFEQKDSD